MRQGDTFKEHPKPKAMHRQYEAALTTASEAFWFLEQLQRTNIKHRGLHGTPRLDIFPVLP